MANTIKIKQSSVSGRVPQASDLEQGELAINTLDERLYTKNSSGAVVQLGGVYQNKVDATTAPTVNEDSDDGYEVGSIWIDVTNDVAYTCVDATVGGAVWTEGGGAEYTSSATAPSSPDNGDMWFDSTDGILYIRTDSQWIDVSTVASLERYSAGSSAPSSPDDGDIWFDTATGVLYLRAESQWIDVSTSPEGQGMADIVEDTTPQLGGNLDLNSSDITGTGNIAITGNATVSGEFIGTHNGAVNFHARNESGSTITKGKVVYISGVSGTKPTVGLADANGSGTMPAFGVVASDAANNADIEIITFGTLSDVDTSSFTEGDTLYVSDTAGELTATAPTGESSLLQNIGKVQRSHATAGSIKVGGAGRTAATPNLDSGNIFIGNVSNQSTTSSLDTEVGNLGYTKTTYSVQDGELSENNFTNADHTKLDGIEASADVTDATNVASAGALMKSGGTMTGSVQGSTLTDSTNTGNITLDFATNQNFVLTLTGNVTLDNPSTETVGQSGFITFIQDGTGSRTVSLGTDFETAGGTGLSLSSTASTTDLVPYVVVASGRILLGTPQLAFA